MFARALSRLRAARAVATCLAAAVGPRPTGNWAGLETDRLSVYTDDSPTRLVDLTTSLHRLDQVIAATPLGIEWKRARPLRRMPASPGRERAVWEKRRANSGSSMASKSSGSSPARSSRGR